MHTKKIIMGLGLVVLVVVFAYAGYWFGGQKNKFSEINEVGDSVAEINGENEIKITASTTVEKNDRGKIIFDFSTYKVIGDDLVKMPVQKYSLPKEIASAIVWQAPVEIEKLGFFYPEQGIRTKDQNDESVLTATPYYLTGLFSFEGKTGAIVFADVGCEDCFGGIQNPATMFVLYDGKVVLVEKMSPEDGYFPAKNYIVLKNVLVDSDFFIPELNLDKKITILRDGKKYELIPTNHDGPVVRSHNENSSVSTVVYTDPVLGPVYQLDNRFEVVGSDGRSWYFQYWPQVLEENGNVKVVFKNEVTGIYDYVTKTGCGFNADPAVISGIVSSSLEVVGAIANQYPVYTLKNNESKLRQKYEGMYYPDGSEKMSYEKFIADNPLVYFYDDFDRLIEMSATKYAPAAECGKPVIYLYPEKTTRVEVAVTLSHWSYSEPKYHDGWQVWAQPSGQLTEVSTGKNYPYLYWEGTGVAEQPVANTGFVVERSAVSGFLHDKLAQLGLNQKEAADFREFWEPRMQKAPYYFVTFFDTNAMNKIAPLSIEPKPDTVIRILMDYHPLSQPIIVKEEKLWAPARKGFTVVEWGGVLGRE